MKNDDLPRRRVLSRREVIALLGASSAMLFVGCAASTDLTGASTGSDSTGSSTSSCVVRPELTEGPYYVEEELAGFLSLGTTEQSLAGGSAADPTWVIEQRAPTDADLAQESE